MTKKGSKTDGEESFRGDDASSETNVSGEVKADEKENEVSEKEIKIGDRVWYHKGTGATRRVCPATVLDITSKLVKNERIPTLALFVMDKRFPMGPFVVENVEEGIEVENYTKDLEIARAAAGYDKHIAPALA